MIGQYVDKTRPFTGYKFTGKDRSGMQLVETNRVKVFTGYAFRDWSKHLGYNHLVIVWYTHCFIEAYYSERKLKLKLIPFIIISILSSPVLSSLVS